MSTARQASGDVCPFEALSDDESDEEVIREDEVLEPKGKAGFQALAGGGGPSPPRLVPAGPPQKDTQGSDHGRVGGLDDEDEGEALAVSEHLHAGAAKALVSWGAAAGLRSLAKQGEEEEEDEESADSEEDGLPAQVPPGGGARAPQPAPRPPVQRPPQQSVGHPPMQRLQPPPDARKALTVEQSDAEGDESSSNGSPLAHLPGTWSSRGPATAFAPPLRAEPASAQPLQPRPPDSPPTLSQHRHRAQHQEAHHHADEEDSDEDDGGSPPRTVAPVAAPQSSTALQALRSWGNQSLLHAKKEDSYVEGGMEVTPSASDDTGSCEEDEPAAPSQGVIRQHSGPGRQAQAQVEAPAHADPPAPSLPRSPPPSLAPQPALQLPALPGPTQAPGFAEAAASPRPVLQSEHEEEVPPPPPHPKPGPAQALLAWAAEAGLERNEVGGGVRGVSAEDEEEEEEEEGDGGQQRREEPPAKELPAGWSAQAGGGEEQACSDADDNSPAAAQFLLRAAFEAAAQALTEVPRKAEDKPKLADEQSSDGNEEGHGDEDGNSTATPGTFGPSLAFLEGCRHAAFPPEVYPGELSMAIQLDPDDSASPVALTPETGRLAPTSLQEAAVAGEDEDELGSNGTGGFEVRSVASEHGQQQLDLAKANIALAAQTLALQASDNLTSSYVRPHQEEEEEAEGTDSEEEAGGDGPTKSVDRGDEEVKAKALAVSEHLHAGAAKALVSWGAAAGLRSHMKQDFVEGGEEVTPSVSEHEDAPPTAPEPEPRGTPAADGNGAGKGQQIKQEEEEEVDASPSASEKSERPRRRSMSGSRWSAGPPPRVAAPPQVLRPTEFVEGGEECSPSVSDAVERKFSNDFMDSDMEGEPQEEEIRPRAASGQQQAEAAAEATGAAEASKLAVGQVAHLALAGAVQAQGKELQPEEGDSDTSEEDISVPLASALDVADSAPGSGQGEMPRQPHGAVDVVGSKWTAEDADSEGDEEEEKEEDVHGKAQQQQHLKGAGGSKGPGSEDDESDDGEVEVRVAGFDQAGAPGSLPQGTTQAEEPVEHKAVVPACDLLGDELESIGIDSDVGMEAPAVQPKPLQIAAPHAGSAVVGRSLPPTGGAVQDASDSDSDDEAPAAKPKPHQIDAAPTGSAVVGHGLPGGAAAQDHASDSESDHEELRFLGAWERFVAFLAPAAEAKRRQIDAAPAGSAAVGRGLPEAGAAEDHASDTDDEELRFLGAWERFVSFVVQTDGSDSEEAAEVVVAVGDEEEEDEEGPEGSEAGAGRAARRAVVAPEDGAASDEEAEAEEEAEIDLAAAAPAPRAEGGTAGAALRQAGVSSPFREMPATSPGAVSYPVIRLEDEAWQCEVCEHHNPGSARACTACETARPPLPDDSVELADSPTMWSCPACTLENASDSQACDACGSARPPMPDPPPAAARQPVVPAASGQADSVPTTTRTRTSSDGSEEEDDEGSEEEEGEPDHEEEDPRDANAGRRLPAGTYDEEAAVAAPGPQAAAAPKAAAAPSSALPKAAPQPPPAARPSGAGTPQPVLGSPSSAGSGKDDKGGRGFCPCRKREAPKPPPTPQAAASQAAE